MTAQQDLKLHAGLQLVTGKPLWQIVITSFLFLVVRPGAPSSVLLFPVAMPGALVASLFLVVRPGAPSSNLAPSSKARSP